MKEQTMKALLFILPILLIQGCADSISNKFDSGDVAFGNSSDLPIRVEKFECDGKSAPYVPGYLGPGNSRVGKYIAGFPLPLPDTFTIYYRINDKQKKQDIPTTLIRNEILNQPKHKDLTLLIIFNRDKQFELKLYFKNRNQSIPHEGKLWPDYKMKNYSLFRRLVIASYNGNNKEVENLIAKGAPTEWADNPIGLSPLEWTARWNHIDAFQQLMAVIPEDFPSYKYASCLKLAAQDDNSEILEVLLASPHSKGIPKWALQNIFYSACKSAKKLSTLQSLLESFDVGVDFKVRDYGHTLLFAAVQADNTEFAKWLVSQGANRDAQLQDGSTLIECARSELMKEILSK